MQPETYISQSLSLSASRRTNECRSRMSSEKHPCSNLNLADIVHSPAFPWLYAGTTCWCWGMAR
eukprot:5588884-Prymnesium_polylepis.3